MAAERAAGHDEQRCTIFNQRDWHVPPKTFTKCQNRPPPTPPQPPPALQFPNNPGRGCSAGPGNCLCSHYFSPALAPYQGQKELRSLWSCNHNPNFFSGCLMETVKNGATVHLYPCMLLRCTNCCCLHKDESFYFFSFFLYLRGRRTWNSHEINWLLLNTFPSAVYDS